MTFSWYARATIGRMLVVDGRAAVLSTVLESARRNIVGGVEVTTVIR